MVEAAVAAELEKDIEIAPGIRVYRWGDLVVTPGLSDRMLAEAWVRFEQENLLPILFYDNPQTLYGFLKDYLDPETCTMGCWVESEGKLELAGMAWINKSRAIGEFHRADCGEAFFKSQWGTRRPVRFGQMCLEWGFDHLNVDVLGGVTPAENRGAVLYAGRLGMEVCGPIPAGCVWHGELAPVYISTLTRAMWAERRPWKEQ